MSLVRRARSGSRRGLLHTQRIYAVSENENDTIPELREIDLSTKTTRVIRLVQLAPESVLDLASGDGGNILFITAKNLWSFDPRSRRATKLCSAPEKPFRGVSYDPKSHVAYVTVQAEHDRLYKVKNGHELVPVCVRRHDQISCLVFSSEGKLFYEESGELWCGEITSDTGDEVEEKEIFSVTAERYAPLAYLETHANMSSEMYVENLAVARDGIYVQLLHPRSLGGGLWGVLLKLPPPIREAETERDSSVGESTVKRLGQTGQILQRVKSLGDTENVALPGMIEVSLGASPDGSRVYYKKDDGEYLVTNGRTEKLQLRESDQKADAGISNSVGANSAEAKSEPPSSPTLPSNVVAAAAEREIDAISTQNIDTLVSFYADKVVQH